MEYFALCYNKIDAGLEMSMNSRELLKLLSFEDQDELDAMQEAEEKLAEITELAKQHSPAYQAKEQDFVATLQEVSANLIFKLVEIDPEHVNKPEYKKEIAFKEKFKEYCEAHPGLWHNFLVGKGYHGDVLRSLNQGESCSTLKQYLGQFLLGQWKQNHDAAILNKACEMNIFPALQARCDSNIELLFSGRLTAEQIHVVEGQIFEDIKHLTNQYWAPGYIYSHTVFMKLAELHHLSLPSSDDLEEMQSKNIYLLAALECELMAAKLYKHPISQQIFREHDLADWLNQLNMGTDDVDNADEAEDVIKKALNKREKVVLKALHISKDSQLYSKMNDEVEVKLSQFKI
jgi:hypothetical protein